MYNGGKDESNEEMRSYINSPGSNMANGYCTNEVITSQYTVLTFLPKNLHMQFSRLANVYFLIISALQLAPLNLSPTNRFATAGPFAVILCLSMLREMWEDSKRHKADTEVNGRITRVVRAGGALDDVRWADVAVGDVLYVAEGQELPADVVMLSSGGPDGMCYIDSCNLDGETNLKTRMSLQATKGAITPARVGQLGGKVEYEPPNSRLYSFSGRLEVQGSGGGGGEAVDVENVLLRGSTLRNTPWIMGLVVYTGQQTKIMMNATKRGVAKQSTVEKTVNFLLVGLLFFELLAVTFCALGMYAHIVEDTQHWYIPYVAQDGWSAAPGGWFTFLILLNNYVPISLYISLEVAHLVQGMQIEWDECMYHHQTDTAALTRTTNLNEELGQVEYIFSDKTGTLTQNVMEFRKCWVVGGAENQEGSAYGYGTTEVGRAAAMRMGRGAGDREVFKGDIEKAQFHRIDGVTFDDARLLEDYRASGGSGALGEFVLALSLAHTVVPEGGGKGCEPSRVKYQAESPDEGALVDFARSVGWFFHTRASDSVTVNVHGEDKVFKVLNVNRFTSSRGRMSVVIGHEGGEGGGVLYCKGADSVMYNHMKHGERRKVEDKVRGYAGEGLRTLVVAKRVLTAEEWREYNSMFQAASTALEGREEALEAAADEIEQELELLGVTAIEDKLQHEVMETISALAKAGIKLWVLTGDKRETAENIGYACELLREGMVIERIDGGDLETVRRQVEDIRNRAVQDESSRDRALVIDGAALLHVFSDKEGGNLLQAELLEYAKECASVICCRASPSQKRLVVAMVRGGCEPEPVTLSIGDGANDVPMILEAHVGVGISGNEGMQAVRSSDYAIAQFQYLKRLILVHGRTNYRRASVLILYSLYKQMSMVTCLFLYSAWTAWTGTALFDSFILTGFNTFYTFLPPIVFACLDMDVPATAALAYPQLYIPGQKGECLNSLQLATWSVNGLAHCAAAVLVPLLAFATGDDVAGLGEVGTTVMCSLAIGCNIRILLEMRNITVLSGSSVALSVVSFFVWAHILSNTWSTALVGDSFSGVAGHTFSNPIMWLSTLCSVTMMLTFDVAMIYGHRQYFPDPVYVVQEMVHGYGPTDRIPLVSDTA